MGAAIEILGPPDHDYPNGAVIKSLEKDGLPPITRNYRALIYENLSKTVIVFITDYLKDRVSFGYQGKGIEAKNKEK